MISNPPPHLNDSTVSSHLGRKWLKASDSRAVTGGIPTDQPGIDLIDENQTVIDVVDGPARQSSDQVSSVRSSKSGTVFVKIPDVSASIGDAFSALDYSLMNDAEELATALSRASEERLNAIGSMGVTDNVGSSPVKETDHKSTDPSRNDLPEPPTEWTDKPPTKEGPRKDTDKPSEKHGSDQAIDKLANAIIARFPLGDPTVLMFVGSESNKHIDETCARVASTLAERGLGRILLLDSDTRGHSLSNASGVSGQLGITDVVNDSIGWESTIYGRSSTNLDFLASGTSVFHHPDSRDRLRHTIAEMKREYQFICISAGDARSPSARIWNDICDGSYLLVSMKNSNRTIAKSAVTEMQSSGARLLGCVVTDVD
jgi:Mrp family chromosome partitioning ATPase